MKANIETMIIFQHKQNDDLQQEMQWFMIFRNMCFLGLALTQIDKPLMHPDFLWHHRAAFAAKMSNFSLFVFHYCSL